MSLAKHIFKVGAWTGVSRVLGFVRDLLIASTIGAGRLSDIFLTAFRLPNMVRDLLGEGALSLAFVPMFSEHKNRKVIGPYFASNVFSWLMLLLLCITIVATIFMPVIIWAIAPGFASDPGKMELTITASRILFVYVILVCGSGFMASILNAFSEFAIAAMMPALLNVFIIGALILAMHLGVDENTLYLLSAAVIFSGIVQFFILWRRLRARKFGLRLIRPRVTPHVKTMMRRIGIGFVGSGFYQLNILVGSLIASFQTGAVTWLYFADRMVQLPFAIIGLAAGTVLLTTISDALCAKNFDKIYHQQNQTLRSTMMLTMPCVAGLIALAFPIIHLIFERGAWTPESTIMVAIAMSIQALALPAMTTSQVFSRTLFAAQDMKTPIRINVITIIIDIIIMLALVKWIGFLVVPIVTVFGGWLRNTWYRIECRRRGLYKTLPGTNRALFAFGALAAVMGGGLWLANAAGLITGIFTLGIAIAAGGAVYLPVAWIANKKIK
ncbi:MAG: murein biosynthesis integral membrane protein MurJ [Alphaproteobacteria bacterium]|nr:murein biosynthesis integral membrane protein MurJ [Alphaproteobacteria bacterium]